MFEQRPSLAALLEGLRPIDRPALVEIVLPTSVTTPSADAEVWESRHEQRWVRNVSNATLIPVLPQAATATGAAVVIAPGGAFRALSIDNEGLDVARWLAECGIAAFVLKYRLLATPPDTSEFYAELRKLDAMAATHALLDRELGIPALADEDVERALAFVRSRASIWHVDPTRVGVLGFSAGAMLALASGASDRGEPPAFVGAIYPSFNALAVHSPPPPALIVASNDDPLFAKKGFGIVDAWLAAGGQVELHCYARGGHGFGMQRQGLPIDGWPRLLVDWLEMNQLLAPGLRTKATE